MSITAEQKDLIKEIFNTGVGAASATLEEMAGTEVLLTVPYVDIIRLGDLISEIKKSEGPSLSAITQNYSGPFEGTAILLYSETSSLKLVQLLTGTALPVERISEFEEDALCEVGNIVLNACLATVGNIFKAEIETELPKLLTGSAEKVLTLNGKLPMDRPVIFLKMGFNLATRELRGYLGFILDAAKIEELLKGMDILRAGLIGE